jgi:hypothetical protein
MVGKMQKASKYKNCSGGVVAKYMCTSFTQRAGIHNKRVTTVLVHRHVTVCDQVAPTETSCSHHVLHR